MWVSHKRMLEKEEIQLGGLNVLLGTRVLSLSGYI